MASTVMERANRWQSTPPRSMAGMGRRITEEVVSRASPLVAKSRSPYLIRPLHPNAESARRHMDLQRTLMALDETCQNILWMEGLLLNRNALSDEEHYWRCSVSEDMIHDMLQRASDIMEVRADTALIPLPSLPTAGISPTQPIGD